MAWNASNWDSAYWFSGNWSGSSGETPPIPPIPPNPPIVGGGGFSPPRHTPRRARPRTNDDNDVVIAMTLMLAGWKRP